MAVKRIPKRRQAAQEAPKYRCRDCAHSYDWQSRALDGHMILCRCPFRKEGGKYLIFLSDYQCEEHFKPRQDNGKETSAEQV